MRRPVVSAPRLCVEWLQAVAKGRGTTFDIDVQYREGKWVGAGEPLLYISGSFVHLVDTETIFLMKLGPACVAAFNAYTMCTDLAAGRLPRHGRAPLRRHGDGGADGLRRLGRLRARQAEIDAKGFIGNATAATGALLRPLRRHGYHAARAHRLCRLDRAGGRDDARRPIRTRASPCSSTTSAARSRMPSPAPALSRYCCGWRLAVRVDTPGSRYVEGLDPPTSYAVLERHCPQAIRGYRNEAELRHLVGAGVSAASIHHLRDALNKAGFPR